MTKESIRDKVFDTGIDVMKNAVVAWDPTGICGKILEETIVKARKVELEKRWRSFLLGLSREINSENKSSIEEKLRKIETDPDLSGFIHNLTEDLRKSKTAEIGPLIKGIIASQYISNPCSIESFDMDIIKLSSILTDDEFLKIENFFGIALEMISAESDVIDREFEFEGEDYVLYKGSDQNEIIINLEIESTSSDGFNQYGLNLIDIETNYKWRDLVKKLSGCGLLRVASMFGPHKTKKTAANNRTLNPTGIIESRLDIIVATKSLEKIIKVIKLARVGKDKLLCEEERELEG